jgi:hypothetical protein
VPQSSLTTLPHGSAEGAAAYLDAGGIAWHVFTLSRIRCTRPMLSPAGSPQPPPNGPAGGFGRSTVPAMRARRRTAPSTVERHYRQKCARCDCACASIFCGPAQVWWWPSVVSVVAQTGRHPGPALHGTAPWQDEEKGSRAGVTSPLWLSAHVSVSTRYACSQVSSWAASSSRMTRFRRPRRKAKRIARMRRLNVCPQASVSSW